MEQTFFIPFENSWGIPATFVCPQGEGPFPAILMVHGFMTSRNGDRFMLQKIADGLCANGIASLRIDEISMGENKRSRKDYCLSAIIAEVHAAYHYLEQMKEVDSEKIGLMGHSLGGKVVLYCADLNPKVIVTLNGALNHNFSKRVVGDLLTDETDGSRFILLHTSDGRVEMLFEKYDQDMEEMVKKEFPQYQKDILIAYASADPTCDPINSISYFEQLDNPNKTLLCIEDCNHTFNAKTGDYTKLNELITGMNPWLSKHLK